MQREPTSPDSTQATIAAFLDAPCARELVNDVGPVLGRLATLRDRSLEEAIEPQLLQDAFSAALTGQSSHGRR